MNCDFRDVFDFNVKFSLPRFIEGVPPSIPVESVCNFRLNFLAEELMEYVEAWGNHNLVNAVDAIIDLTYVIYGTACYMGFNPRDDLPRGLAAGLAYQEPRLMAFEGHQEFIMHAGGGLFWLTHSIFERRSVIQARIALGHMLNWAYRAGARTGIPWEQCWGHVHAANMAKVRGRPDGSDSKRGIPFDVVKPAGWQSPEPLIRETLLNAGAVL